MAVKGDKLLDFITADWYNSVSGKITNKLGIPRLSHPDQFWYITVLNHEAVAVPKWTAVSLGSAALDYNTALGHAHNEIIFHTAEYDSADPDNLAILVEPLPGVIGGSARALLCGVSWMRVPESLIEELPYIRIEDIEPSLIPGLVYANSGRIEILRTFNFQPPYLPPGATTFSLMMFGPNGPLSGMLLGPTTIQTNISTDTGYIGLAIIGKKIPAPIGGGESIEYTINSLRTASAGIPSEAPYTGLIIATVTITGHSVEDSTIIGDEVDVVDHSGCVFDLPEADLVGVWGWASERVFDSLDPGAYPGELTPLHWSADDRCCVLADMSTS